MRIEELFKYILTEQEYVSIPQVGSFVRCNATSHISAQSHSIVPPSIHYEFDASRTFDDGAIAQFLCEYAGEDRYAAERMVAEWAQWVQEELNAGRTIRFDGLGTIYTSDGSVHFESQNGTHLATEHAALQAITLPPTRRRTSTPKRGKRVAIVLICVIGLLGGGSLVSYFALGKWPTDFIEIPAVSGLGASPEHVDTAKLLENNELVSTETEGDSTKRAELPRGMTQSHRQGEALRMTLPDDGPKVEYYLVAGSFGQRENADKRCRELAERGYTAQVVRLDTIFRVTIGLYTSKSEAVRKMVEARETTRDNGIWILERNRE